MGRLRFLGLFACLAAIIAIPLTSAGQEATPTPGSASSEVTRESLTSAAASRLEGVAGPLRVERIRIPAGGEWMVAPDEAAIAVLVVETGAVEGESPAPVTIQRAAGGADTAAAEPVAANTAFTLASGDTLVSLAPGGTRLRNLGGEAVGLISIGIGTGDAGAAPGSAAADAGSGLVMALALVVPPPCPPGTEPGSPSLAATPGAGGGGGGAGGVAMAFAAAPACTDEGATPVP